jgi:prepilin-type N-terminal cleavage/methylation domain-containing protein
MLNKFRSEKGFTLIELMIVVAIIAILAVVAVPQFTKYMKNAKTAEATEMLDLIKKGSASYYSSKQVAKDTGNSIYCQFPATHAATPTGVSCCDAQLDADDDERCDAKPANWNDGTWSALKFAITDAHYFQYTYTSAGTLKAAKYTAQANGDLDCDGTYSTFALYGVGDPNATGSDCDAVTQGAIYKDNETE